MAPVLVYQSHAITDFRSLGQIDLVTIPSPFKSLIPGDSVGMLAQRSTRAYTVTPR